LFHELHELQQLLSGAAEEERQIRKVFATTIALDSGATRQLLADTVAAKASEFHAKKLRVKLDLEGLDASDEADTMAQAKVLGTLDDETRRLVEATTLATRNELRFAARLRRAQKRLEHLTHHASALDPWLDSTFGGQGPTKVSEVRRNLDDARRQFPLLTVRATEFADEARRTAQKLAHALTTDPSLASDREPPLIAPLETSTGATKPRPRAPSGSVPIIKKPAAPPKATESGGADFEP
jgi:hypothetical protein